MRLSAKPSRLSKKMEPTKLGFTPKDHADLGEALGMMDFETAAKMSGSRFVVLSGKLSRLDRALLKKISIRQRLIIT